MDFGRVPLDGLDLSLPPDRDISVLDGKAAGSLEIYVGCPVFARADWVGTVYPKGTPSRGFLRAYASQFNALELNSTHYATPAPEILRRWRQGVPEQFRFCPKVPQSISHAHDVLPDDIVLFLNQLSELAPKVGALLLQLPPSFSPRDMPYLQALLRSFPKQTEIALELRHPGWFAQARLPLQLRELLAQRGASLVLTDVAGRRDVLHMTLTTSWAFIRFSGHDLHPSDYSRLDAWAERLSQWFKHGLRKLYFFVHQSDEALCAPLVRHFATALKKTSDLEIKAPVDYSQLGQGSLF